MVNKSKNWEGRGAAFNWCINTFWNSSEPSGPLTNDSSFLRFNTPQILDIWACSYEVMWNGHRLVCVKLACGCLSHWQNNWQKKFLVIDGQKSLPAITPLLMFVIFFFFNYYLCSFHLICWFPRSSHFSVMVISDDGAVLWTAVLV